MKKTVFQYLEWSNPKSIAHSAEEEYFNHHASLFNEKSNMYNDTTSVYGIIRACIVLESARNKEKLDYFINTYPKNALSLEAVITNTTCKLPFYKEGDEKIYIPTLDRELNGLYNHNSALLLEPQYQNLFKSNLAYYVDPFKTYGAKLFDSTFTRLILLNTRDSQTYCFYHPYLETILILDKEGRLLQEIPIFDEKIKHPNKTNLFNRLEELMKSYFKADRKEFIEALKNLEFISHPLYEDITYYTNK